MIDKVKTADMAVLVKWRDITKNNMRVSEKNGDTQLYNKFFEDYRKINKAIFNKLFEIKEEK